MNPVQISSDKAAILYDGDCIGQADFDFFDPGYWQARGALTGTATGRGTTFFVRDGSNEWVVRHYRRGGMVARLLGDRYLWKGIEATRAWREWLLLAELFSEGLPVPQPIAARVERQGVFYQADIVTRRLDASPLSQLLCQGQLAEEQWRFIGATLQRFHAAGVWHADLNAHNILIGGSQVFVIDFDRGWRGNLSTKQAQGNLARLHRSLAKLQGIYPEFHFVEADWQALLAGYAEKSFPHSGNSAV